MGAYAAFTSKYTALNNQLINFVQLIDGSNSIDAKALWDTGATSSCISHATATKLSLTPIGKRNIATPSGCAVVNTYCIDIKLPNDIIIQDIIVSDSEIGGQGIDVLIGMDIITKGDFTVSNYNNVTVFTFRTPSQTMTDYVIQSNLQEKLGPKHGKGKRKHK